jgi:hypothetical protein
VSPWQARLARKAIALRASLAHAPAPASPQTGNPGTANGP